MSTRPPRPSPEHTWDRTTKQWYSRRELELERDALLKELAPEFVDIEHAEGGGLAAAGHVKSVALWNVKKALGIEGKVEVHDVLDGAHELVNWPESDRARQYSMAEYVANEGVRQGLNEKLVYIWQLLALGHGDRTIIKLAWEERNLDLTRYEVRKIANEFWTLVRQSLDEEDREGSRQV